MAQPAIQTSFASGEWSPDLFARVDLTKYHNGAALLRNFYVDYRGGAASRMGTKYVLQAYKSASRVRLIPFQASQTIGYVLEFGDHYIRFHFNGAPIVESQSATATGVTAGGVVTVANSYNVGDWVLVAGFVGLTNFNGNFYSILAASGTQVTLGDLNGNAITVTGTWTSGGTLSRVYTIASPYAAADLGMIKYAQSVTQMMITHPSYPPQILTINSAASWTINAIHFGSTCSPPIISNVTSNLPAGTVSYSYVVTAVDSNGDESGPSLAGSISSLASIATTSGSITITWGAVAGAASYNVYKALSVVNATFPLGQQYGFIGNSIANQFWESTPGISPDFAQTPPVVTSGPSAGGVTSIALTNQGSYTVVPSVTFPISPISTATAYASLGVLSIASITHGSPGDIGVAHGFNPTGSTLTFPNGIVVTMTSLLFLTTIGNFDVWQVLTYTLTSPGSVTGVGNSIPSNPVAPIASNAIGPFGPPAFGTGFGFSFNWGVAGVTLTNAGAGYASGGNLIFSPASATATFTVSSIFVTGNPAVVTFFQERMVLAGANNNLQGFQMSQTGSFFDYNSSIPAQADDAITGSIVSGQLNQIKSMINVPTGLMTFTNRGAWLINGGGTNAPVTPTNISATIQAVVGASDLPPLQINYDALYGQSKGYYVRDITFNFYVGVYTGQDISTLSSHLFYGFQLIEWAWAEEPFKTVWAIRSDGIALSLGYVKEQELIGWAHHDTNGQFMSVASVTEQVSTRAPAVNQATVLVDATYFVVQRVVNGVTTQYIERMADRSFAYGAEDAWCVDAGLQSQPVDFGNNGIVMSASAASGNGVTFTSSIPLFSSGSPGDVIRMGGGIATIVSFIDSQHVTANITQPITYVNPYTGIPFPAIGGSIGGAWTIWIPFTTFGGLQHLIGQSVVGLTDGVPVGPLTVSASGTVTLPQAATKVTLGLAFTPQLQTLQLDLGEPTAQGKRKKIVACTARVKDTLGLTFGTSFSNQVVMKDLVIGNVGSATNKVVNGLVTGDARTLADPLWQVPGQYCFQQPNPLPATILGVIPEIVIGDAIK